MITGNKKIKVLVIGSGAREHALCWKLKQSPLLAELYAAPGNPGMAAVARLVELKVDDISGLCRFARMEQIDLTVVGPEYPLSLGVVDAFESEGLQIFGPSRAAARLESSKEFCKQILNAAGVVTAACRVFEDGARLREHIESAVFPLVLKADGLAAGKGVFVCMQREEAHAALASGLGQPPGSRVLVEEYLSGLEASFMVATDGQRVATLASSHDYKRAGEGDRGPNTGGMGSVSPTPRLKPEVEEKILSQVIEPVLAEMRRRATPFRGFLYAGLMLDKNGRISVLEFNARLGDPETQSILVRLESDLLPLLLELSCSGGLVAPLPELSWSRDRAVTVVMAASGYPEKPRLGDSISGLDEAAQLPGVQIFHAGTKMQDANRLVTAGGRVLSVTARAGSIDEAARLAQQGCGLISFDGAQLRRDIGLA